MIELLRYARVKPQGLVSAHMEDEKTICVEFKRFSPENGKEEPERERCLLTVVSLEERKAECEKELEVLKELLQLSKNG